MLDENWKHRGYVNTESGAYEKTHRKHYSSTSTLFSSRRQGEIARQFDLRKGAECRKRSSGGFELLLDAAKSMMPPSPEEENEDDLDSLIAAAKTAGGKTQSALLDILNRLVDSLRRKPGDRRKVVFRWIAEYLQFALTYCRYFPGPSNAALRENLWAEVAAALAGAVEAEPAFIENDLSNQRPFQKSYILQATHVDGCRSTDPVPRLTTCE